MSDIGKDPQGLGAFDLNGMRYVIRGEVAPFIDEAWMQYLREVMRDLRKPEPAPTSAVHPSLPPPDDACSLGCCGNFGSCTQSHCWG